MPRGQIIEGEVPAGAFEGGTEVVFKRARARDADFSNLVFATFTAERSGIDLDEQKLPSGDEYIRIRDAAKRLERAREAVEEWESADERRLALVEVDVLGRFAEDQDDLFVRRADADLPIGVVRRLWALLE